MKKHSIFLGLLMLFSFFGLTGFSSTQFVWQSQGQQWQGTIQDIDIYRGQAYVATTKGLYQYDLTKGGLRRPEQLLRMSSYDVLVDDHQWFVAGAEGVFKSDDQGQTWDRIFDVDQEVSEVAYHVIDVEDGLVVGTNKGCYYRSNNALQWQKLSGDLMDANVYALGFDEDFVYAMTPSTLFSIDRDTWKMRKIYQHGSANQEDVQQRPLRTLTVDIEGDLWLVTRQDILKSNDQGQTWNHIDDGGVPLSGVYDLYVDSSIDGLMLYLAMDDGVYIFNEERGWRAAYQGLNHTDIRAIDQDASGQIYIGGKERLYVLKEYAISAEQEAFEKIKEAYRHEPSIAHVQQRAVIYAEVHPEKIQRWRKRANWSGVLPAVDVDVARNTDELYHWDNASTSVPDYLTKGIDYTDWDFSVTWDFSKLIWNDDQIDIDTRSRLMVELREDVLDQVTRIYFERRRLQAELGLGDKSDLMFVVEKSLRIDELTAQLDGYTGGWFSRKVSEAESQKDYLINT